MGEAIELGDKVYDEATGFSGTATAIATYLGGDSRIQVSGSADGKPVEWWFEVGRLTKQEGI